MSTLPTHNISINELNSTAWNQRYSNPADAMSMAILAKEQATEQNNEQQLNYARLTIAQLGFWKTASGEHLQEATEALSFFENTNDALATSRAHCICATMYDQYGQYENAMNHAQLAVKTAKESNDLENKADCYTVLGQIYSRTYDYTQAIKKLKQGLEIREQLNAPKAVASSLNLIGRNLTLSKKFAEAEDYYLKSLDLREKTGDTAGIPWTYLGLATLFTDKKELDTALRYYNKAEQAQATKEKRFELLCLIGRGKIYIEQSETGNAITCLLQALETAQQLKITSLIAETHQLLSVAYEKNTDFETALQHYKNYNTIQQELLSNEKVNQLKHQQIAFSVENVKKESEIHRLKNIELKQAFDKIAAQHHELEVKNKEITDSIDYAKYIQDAYLPSREFIQKKVPYAFLLYKPKDIVSGDFYWFQQTESGLLFAAADCTGHGVPGAIMSVICYNALNDTVKKENITRPDLILNRVRTSIMEAFKQHKSYETRKDGMDIALLHLSHFPDAGGHATLQYAGAYNPLWIIRKGKSTHKEQISDSTNTHHLIEIKADRQPVGAHERMLPFTLHECKVVKEDTLYVFSDGYADQFGGEHGERFRTKTFKDLLLSIQNKSMTEQHDSLLETFENWKQEHEQVDDVCVIGLKI